MNVARPLTNSKALLVELNSLVPLPIVLVDIAQVVIGLGLTVKVAHLLIEMLRLGPQGECLIPVCLFIQNMGMSIDDLCHEPKLCGELRLHSRLGAYHTCLNLAPVPQPI